MRSSRLAAAFILAILSLTACAPGRILKTPDPAPVPGLELQKLAEEEALRHHREAMEAARRFAEDVQRMSEQTAQQ